MTFVDVLRIWFIAVWSLSIVGFLVSVIQFFRLQRKSVQQQIGPLPTPITLLNIIVLAILLMRVGKISVGESIFWTLIRILGLGLSLYGMILLPWTMQKLDRFGLPGAGILQDHELVTSGPYQLVRHPGYSAYLALWLGTALGMLNWLLLVLWPIGLTGAFLSSHAEEKLLRDKFGQDYREYAQDTSRFIPGIW
jgi:protein-S-isoprenylcysteine O-methyltransferase Ste14